MRNKSFSKMKKSAENNEELLSLSPEFIRRSYWCLITHVKHSEILNNETFGDFMILLQDHQVAFAVDILKRLKMFS